MKNRLGLKAPILSFLICIIMSMLTAFVCVNSVFTKPKVASANGTGTIVDELVMSATEADYDIDGKVTKYNVKFNGANLGTMYDTIFGIVDRNAKPTYTLNDINNLFIRNPDGIDVNSVRGSKGEEFIVKFGDRFWIPTYLSQVDVDGEKHTILTLWYADSTILSLWNNNLGHVAGKTTVYDSTDTQYNNHLSTMYGTSLIRAVITGKDYFNDPLDAKKTSGASKQHSTFKNIISRYGDYLITPNQVEWQATYKARRVADLVPEETGDKALYFGTAVSSKLDYNYEFPNENLASQYSSTISGLTDYVYYDNRATESNVAKQINMNRFMDQKTDYLAWGEDKLWLPSAGEVGSRMNSGVSTANKAKYDARGLWNLSMNQLTNFAGTFYNTKDGGTIASKPVWLRTAMNNTTQKALTLSGSYTGTTTPTNPTSNTAGAYLGAAVINNKNSTYAVRPACHLDLTAAERDAEMYNKPENQKKAYTGAPIVFTLPTYGGHVVYTAADTTSPAPIANKVTVTNVGVYNYRAKLSDGLFWADGDGASDNSVVNFTLTVTEQELYALYSDESSVEERKVHRSYTYREKGKKAEGHSIAVDPTMFRLSTDANSAPTITEHKYIVTGYTGTVPNSPSADESAGWKYLAELPDESKAPSIPGSYLIWYRVKAGDDAQCVGYYIISIEKATIILQKNADFGTSQYGDTASKEALLAKFQSTVTGYDSKDTDYIINFSDLNLTNLDIYPTDSSGMKVPTGDGAVWPVGNYYVNIAMLGGNDYITFQWKDGVRPTYNITPRDATISWKAPEGGSGDVLNGFKIPYTGEVQTPIAYFTDYVSKQDVILQTSGGMKDVSSTSYTAGIVNASDYTNYKFTISSSTCQFIIVQAENSWITHYHRNDWDEKATPSEETKPVPKFSSGTGTDISIKYYTNSALTIEANGFTSIGTYYVQIIVSGTNNYTELKETQSFKVLPHSHTYGTGSYVKYGDGHVQTCATCGEESDLIPHNYKKSTSRPTCTEEGKTTYTCVCGDQYEDDIVGLADHKLRLVAGKAATSSSPGVYAHYKCSVCNQLFADVNGKYDVSEAETVIPAGSTEEDPKGGWPTIPGNPSESGGGTGGGGGSGGGSTSDNGPGGGGSDNGDIGPSILGWLKANWWWLLIILLVLLAIFIIFKIVATSKRKRREEAEAKRREEERKRQMEMLMQMSMMGNSAPAPAPVAPPPQPITIAAPPYQQLPPQLPYNYPPMPPVNNEPKTSQQDMINSAVNAAMAAAFAAMNNNQKPQEPAYNNIVREVHVHDGINDVDGFYDTFDDFDTEFLDNSK